MKSFSKVISYVMKKKDNKYVLARYIFENDKFVSRYWVNTYYDLKSAKEYFDNFCEFMNDSIYILISKNICNNIWVVSYGKE